MEDKYIIKEANRVLKAEILGIRSLSKNFNKKFVELVKGITKIKGRVIVTGIGKSGHIANKVSATLSSTGTPSQFVHPSEASHGDLGSIQKND